MSQAIYPNQRSITVHKSKAVRGEFTTINLRATMKAMKDLSYSAYMLYSYCSLNKDGYEFGLSKAYLCENTALSKNTYYSAFHELEEKGYFVCAQESTTKYHFYESPELGHACTKKRDDLYREQVQNINNKQQENKELPALSLDAPGGAPIKTGMFYNF